MKPGELYPVVCEGITDVDVRWMEGSEHYEVYFPPFMTKNFSELLEKELRGLFGNEMTYDFYTMGIATIRLKPAYRAMFELIMVERIPNDTLVRT